MAAGAMSTPVTTAPARAKRTRSTPAPQPDVEHLLPALAVEVDETEQVMQLVEVVLVEIGEEPRAFPAGCG